MSTTPYRILLLDDDYITMWPLKEYLEEIHHYEVELTAAKSLLMRLVVERFDLICVDLSIHPIGLDAAGEPVENLHFDGINWRYTGLEFLRQLRAGELGTPAAGGTSLNVPIVVISALAHSSVNGQPILSQAHTHYIEKPYAVEEVVNTVAHLLEQHR